MHEWVRLSRRLMLAGVALRHSINATRSKVDACLS